MPLKNASLTLAAFLEKNAVKDQDL
ncbi:hypothetical protein Gotur_025079 [Gossypium turneri]